MESSLTTDVLAEFATFGDYTVTAKLGGGTMSTVWKAEHRSSGQVVALKQVALSKLTRTLKNSLGCELNFLSTVNHPNIVRLLEVFQAEGCIFLVLEFCAGGNLASYIRLHGGVREQIARKFMQQLGAALKLLNSHHIIHRDLKPENVLRSSPQGDVVLKIADFGLSRTAHPNDHIETVCGSPLYMAPEILQFRPYDEKVDMWSVGVMLFELLHGYPPYRGRSNVQLIRKIQSCSCLPFSEPILSGLHPDCVDMCSRLLSIKPENRLSFDEFYRHAFLRFQGVGGEGYL
ncbi:serine/threonine-protein kinase ATG1t [Actinidia eriantha]|uniref:serine/threonine-protein kinase ATG1t n=1 Tax=Actinidia eriantha TaxID=165200 RepID=UPI00258E2C68|nr:serine/threonine-protein kinase ATG1t [Actinidia eriantha]